MASNDDSTGVADRFLFVGYLLVLFWVPLPVASNHLWAWSLFEVFVFALAIVWLVLFAMGRVSATTAFRRAWPALLLFAMLFAWVIFQLAPLPLPLITLLSPNGAEIYGLTQSEATLSLDPSSTRAAALKTLAYGVFFALTLLLINRRGRLRTLALVLVLSGAFQAIFGTFMTLSGLEYGFFIAKADYTGFVTGTFVNPDHLAGYLVMCLAIGAGLVLADMSASPTVNQRGSERRSLRIIVSDTAPKHIALIIMVIGLVLSKSSMGNFAIFSGLMIAGGYYALVVRRFSVGIITLFVSMLLIEILFIGSIFGRGEVAAENRQTSAETEIYRMEVARETLEIMRDYPLTGTGAGSFASTYPMYDSGTVGFWHYKYAHNDYLQFGSEFGLPGLALLVGIVLLSLWQAGRAQLKRNDRLMRGLGCGAVSAILALLIYSAVHFNLQIPANAATFVVILAMGWIVRWLGQRARQEYGPPNESSSTGSVTTRLPGSSVPG